MTALQRTTTLSAPAEQVFAFVTNPDNFSEYVADYSNGRVTSDRSTGLGSAFSWSSKLGPVVLEAEERVVDWEEPRRVVYEGTLAGVTFRSRMDVDDHEGGSALRVSVDYSVPASRGGRAVETVLRPMIARDIRRSLERLVGRFGSPDDEPSKDELVSIYRRHASSYDTSVQLYRLLGFRLESYRRMAVDALELKPGDTVVEIGCGTGENFGLLHQRVGPSGRIIGVDLTDAMLEQARRKGKARGYDNLQLVCSDAARFEFPEKVDAILSTLALTHCPEYDTVIERGAAALAPTGRWVVLDMKMPARWPSWVMGIGLALCRPFGVTLGAASRHPWESMQKHLAHTRMLELYFGLAYLCVGSNEAARPG